MRAILLSLACLAPACMSDRFADDAAPPPDAPRVPDAAEGTADAGVADATPTTDPDASVFPWSDRLILRGTVVAPLGPFEGEVYVSGNLIACVDVSCAGEPGADTARVIETGGVIFPGLIDTHNHGLFNVFDEADWDPAPIYTNHDQWVDEPRQQEVTDAKQYLGAEFGSPVDVRCEMGKYAEVKALIAGTTSMVLAPGLSRNCWGSVARTIDTPANDLGDDVVQTAFTIPSTTTAQSVCDNFADGTTRGYLVHAGEGTDVAARNELTTLEGRAGGCLMAPQTAIVHGTAFTDVDFQLLASAGMKLVWSPRSNMSLYGATTRIDLALAAGITTIALAPDWSLGGSVNLLDELRYADLVDEAQYADVLSPRRLFEMTSIDAARILGWDDQLGTLEVGKRADLFVIQGGLAADPYDALLLATPQAVSLVAVDGRVMYGDVAFVSGMTAGPPCEALDVCGAPKLLCIAEDDPANLFDQTFADVVGAVEMELAAYDAMVAPVGIAPMSPIAPLTACP